MDICFGGQSVEQCKGSIPRCGDHPVRALFRWQIMGEGDQAIAAVRSMHGVYGMANAFGVDLEGASLETPAFGFEAAQQDAHE